MLCVFLCLRGQERDSDMPWRADLDDRLPSEIRASLAALNQKTADDVREIRFRTGCRPEICTGAGGGTLPVLIGRAEMDELMAALCGCSMYACEQSMARGYLPLPGGHRAGMCGRLERGPDGTVRMSGVTSVCIRIARYVQGASQPVRQHLIDGAGRPRSVLVLGPPGCGKTTLLRDAAVYLSDEAGMQVSVADEREELFLSGAQRAYGKRLDVITGGDKAEMIGLLLRSMAPQVIVCDEIGGRGDAEAILDAARCGAAVLASAHADGIEAMAGRPVLAELGAAGSFERYIVLGPAHEITAVYDCERKRL